MTTKQTTPEFNKLLEGQFDVMSQLLQASYSQIHANDELSIVETSTLIELICTLELLPQQPLLEAVYQQIGPLAIPTVLDQAIVLFSQHFFNQYIQHTQLPEEISEALTCIQKKIVNIILLHHQWPWRTEHNLAEVLHLIHQKTMGWHSQLGRASSRYLNTLIPLIDNFASTIDSADTEHARQVLAQFFESEDRRIQKLEKRLHEGETGALHARHAKSISARTLNQLMAGKKLPETISQFLQGPVHQSMQLQLINKKDDEIAWKESISLIKTLICSLQPINDESMRQSIYQSITEIADKLRGIMLSLHHDSNQLHVQLSRVETEHLKVLQNEPLTYAPFELINNTDPLSNSQTVISSGLLKQVHGLKEGQWFFHHEEDPPYIKLTLKNDELQQLLFTNFFGVKINIYSFEEFAYRLSSKIVTPMNNKDNFKRIGEILIHKLYAEYQSKKQQQAAIYAEKQKKLKQKLQAQEQERKTALKAAKDLAEAQQQARINAENEAKAAEIERRKNLDPQKEAMDINRLNIGGLMKFYNDKGDSQQLKLAVKLQSSGKYIFVDRTGIKRKEVLINDLEEMLDEGSAKIVNVGSYFEDSLEKVVNGLRKGRTS